MDWARLGFSATISTVGAMVLTAGQVAEETALGVSLGTTDHAMSPMQGVPASIAF